MNKREVLEEILIKEKYKDKNYPINKLLDVISKKSYNLKELGKSSSAISKFTRRNFPGKPRTTIKLCTYLLAKYKYKYCSKCEEVKKFENFSKNAANSSSDKLNSWCRECFSIYQKEDPQRWRNYTALRRAKERQVIPKWQSIIELENYYNACPINLVDHIIPLTNEKVCGLHCVENLQYMTALDNSIKHNKFKI